MIKVYLKYLVSYAKTLYLWLFCSNIKMPITRTISCSTIFDCSNNSRIIIGSGIETVGEVCFQSHGGELKIGSRCYFNRNCILACREKIEIGNHCLFGPGVYIYDHDHAFNEGVVPQKYRTEKVIIEDECWIGANVIILKGSHIGRGTIIGAGAVITGNIPSHSTVISKKNLEIVNR